MTTPAKLQTPCSIIQPSQDVRDTHKLRKTDKTEPDSFTTLWVGGFQSKRKSTQILRSELSKLLDADASSSKRLTHGSFKVQVLTSDAPRMLRLNGLAHKDFPSGIKIERYAPLPGKQVKLTGDTAEHGETSAPTPASDDPNGSVSKREGSDEDRSRGKGRDEIMTASKAPTLPESHGNRSSGKGRDEIMTVSKAATVPENLDAMQVDGLSRQWRKPTA